MEETRERWPHLKTTVRLEATRVENHKESKETRYYISDQSGCDAAYYNALVRGHWGIENHLHWHLDVTFREDQSLGLRCSTTGYQYSEIISIPFWHYYCGGDHIEDTGTHLGSHLKLRPGTAIPSPDTLLRGIKKLSEADVQYISDKGSSYALNKSERLNGLMLDILLQTGQLTKGHLYDLDFDHQFIATEKYDTLYSYRKERGYFPGVATIGGNIVGIENRAANANVRFHQGDTLKRVSRRLADRGIFIDRCPDGLRLFLRRNHPYDALLLQ